MWMEIGFSIENPVLIEAEIFYPSFSPTINLVEVCAPFPLYHMMLFHDMYYSRWCSRAPPWH